MKAQDRKYLNTIDKKRTIQSEMLEILERDGTEFEIPSDDVRLSVLEADLKEVNTILES